MKNSYHHNNLASFEEARKNPTLPYWWFCPENHLYRHSYRERSMRKCPICLGKLVEPGLNDIATTHPKLLKEWSWENIYAPAEVAINNGVEIFWKCQKCSQTYSTPLNKKTGCPYCHGRKIVVGVNDLSTTHPQISAKISRNSKLQGTQVTAGSQKELLWVCDNGHEWKAPVARVVRGSSCPTCNHLRVTPSNSFAHHFPKLAEEWGKSNSISPTEVSKGSGKTVEWECSSCGHEWSSRVKDRAESPSCPSCKNGSQGERELREFLKDLEKEVVYNDREVIAPLEIDLYFPELKIGIEFNGLYWHRESARGKNYHLEKFLKAKEVGVELIQVWEDDWIFRREILEKMLLRKLGSSREERVGARETMFKKISYRESEEFLTRTHIQGGVRGSYYYGLKYKGELAAVMVLKKQRDYLLLTRFATDRIVHGGFSKLLKEVRRRHVEEVVTFSDNSISEGELYSLTGFVKDRELPPDYSYIVRGRREHKFGYRKKRFKNDPELLWEPGLTERELAELNGLERVWDAGKIRWVLPSQNLCNSSRSMG